MLFWKKTRSLPDEPAMKSILYRGGVVTFRIPAHWKEEYSDTDGGMFYQDDSDAGTLRLTIMTLKSPERVQSPPAQEILQVIIKSMKKDGIEGSISSRKDGNAVFKYQEASSEDGVKLTIFYWMIANPVPPHHIRIATFSYTTLAKLRNSPETQRDLKMLEAEIEAAQFSPDMGVVSH